MRILLGWIGVIALISLPVTGFFLFSSIDEAITGKEISWDSQETPSFLAVLISGAIVVGAALAYRSAAAYWEEDVDAPIAEPPVVPSLNDINQNQDDDGAVISRSEPSGAETPVQKNKRKIIID